MGQEAEAQMVQLFDVSQTKNLGFLTPHPMLLSMLTYLESDFTPENSPVMGW